MLNHPPNLRNQRHVDDSCLDHEFPPPLPRASKNQWCRPTPAAFSHNRWYLSQLANQRIFHMGVNPKIVFFPEHGWFISWKILLKLNWWFGSTPILGNTHIFHQVLPSDPNLGILFVTFSGVIFVTSILGYQKVTWKKLAYLPKVFFGWKSKNKNGTTTYLSSHNHGSGKRVNYSQLTHSSPLRNEVDEFGAFIFFRMVPCRFLPVRPPKNKVIRCVSNTPCFGRKLLCGP